MKPEEITPHLNKLATLYLSNNKKKVGFLFLEESHTNHGNENSIKEVCFVNVQRGRRLIMDVENLDLKRLSKVREVIPVREIVRIRSSK